MITRAGQPTASQQPAYRLLDTLSGLEKTGLPLMTLQIKTDIIHIGYPKAASTFIEEFLNNHPAVTTDHNCVTDLLLMTPGTQGTRIAEKPSSDKIHYSRDESIAESICLVGELKNWRKYHYVPGAWDRVKNDIIVDPVEAASRLYKVHSQAKILILIREQSDWLQSVYKYVVSQLPWNCRSFADYCTTPSGIVHLGAGHFDRTISAYVETFGSNRVCVLRFEDIVIAPRRFTAELCGFIGISERPLPRRRENETHAQIARIQRYFPLINQLPRVVNNALKPHAMRLIPGARRPILSPREIRVLRSIYAASNQRTEKLLSQL
jgi:sulfotransferase family protein